MAYWAQTFHSTRPPSLAQIPTEQVHQEKLCGLEAIMMRRSSAVRSLLSVAMSMSTQHTLWCVPSSGKHWAVSGLSRSRVPHDLRASVAGSLLIVRTSTNMDPIIRQSLPRCNVRLAMLNILSWHAPGIERCDKLLPLVGRASKRGFCILPVLKIGIQFAPSNFST